MSGARDAGAIYPPRLTPGAWTLAYHFGREGDVGSPVHFPEILGSEVYSEAKEPVPRGLPVKAN